LRIELVCILLGICCNASADPALVAHYTFDEGPSDTIRDTSGNGNHGKNHGAEYVKGPDGTGHVLRFGDGDSFVDCGNPPSLDLTDALTIELWLYRENDRQAGGEPGLVGKAIESYLLSSGSGPWFYVTTGKVRNDCSGSAALKSWHHIVVTFDGKYVRSYSNGKTITVVEAGEKKINHGGNFYLRKPIIWGGKVIPAVRVRIDDVRVYNRALSSQQVMEHYLAEARPRGKDLSLFLQPKVMTHVISSNNVPVIEVNHTDLRPVPPPGAAARCELRDSDGNVIAQHRQPLPGGGHDADWTLDRSLPTGSYIAHVTIEDKHGKTLGESATAELTVKPLDPALAEPYGKARVLNNFVAELANVQHEGGELNITTPRDGWVLILTPDGREMMRYLTKGEHTLNVESKGRVIVRAIGEIIYTELGYEPMPFVTSYGPYTWEYLEKIGLLDNVNVLLVRASLPQNAAHVARWLSSGKKQLFYYNLHWLLNKVKPLTPDAPYDVWSAASAMQSNDVHGQMLDELAGHSYPDEYPHFTRAITRIAANPSFDGKVIYPYCHQLYESEPSRAFAKAIFDSGYRLAEEQYLLEQPTEAQARAYMNQKLRLNMLRYQDHYPDAATRTIECLGFITLPHETQNAHPNVDFKVFLDMQLNLLANDPAFAGLYGLMWYHGAYADEEIQRWAVKLIRHYCIEGKRDRLTDDPYMLSHIVNGDFEKDAEGWTKLPAQPGNIVPGRSPRYGWLQGRFQRDVWEGGDATGGGLPEGRGDRFIVMRRTEGAANQLRQTIKKLMPGRLYSIRLTTADYDELMAGTSVKRDHQLSIQIGDVEVLPEQSFMEIVTNGGGHNTSLFRGDKKLYMNWHRIVFRAMEQTATLTLSDAGGRVGQQIAINGVELAPYLED
jgi:hypothetical protein